MKSSLSYPFILKKHVSKDGPDYSQSVRLIASSFHAPGTGLHRKLRKMLHRLGALSLRSSGKQQPESSWMTLTISSDRSLASFDMQRELRSNVYSLQHVYASHRSVNNLGEPPRSSVQSLLTKIIIIEGGVKPPRARPLQLPTVSHKLSERNQDMAKNQVLVSSRLSDSFSFAATQRGSSSTFVVEQTTGKPSLQKCRVRMGH